MTLCDAGPLVALLDDDDDHHAACMAALPKLPGPLISTWPCLAEAMYLLYRAGGHAAQDALWGYVEDGLLEVRASTVPERTRMRALMRQYKDTPMDLADASLVALAEASDLRRVFTIDRHFRVYRIFGKHAFEVVP